MVEVAEVGATVGRGMRQGLRGLWRRPGWTASVVALVALGLGANLAVFAVLRSVVLRPPPFPQGDRLAMLWETGAGESERPVAPANFLDWRTDVHAFSGLAAFRFGREAWTGDGPPQMLAAGYCSGNFFELLRVAPAAGRLFDLGDEQGGARRVVVSQAFWRRSFGGAAGVVGRRMTLGGEPYEVVGVLPEGFSLLRPADVWLVGGAGIPGGAPVPQGPPERDAHYLYVLGRLQDGVGWQAADAELGTIAARLGVAHPATNAGLGARVSELRTTLAGGSRPVLFALQAGAVLLLLVALANVLTLVILRAVTAARALALRQALGAGVASLVAEAAAEAVLLVGAGGAAALAAAWASTRILVRLAPAGLARLDELRLDPATVAAGLGLAAAVALLAGVPVLQRTMPAAVLRANTAGAGGGRRAARLRAGLGALQIALAFLLLAGTALLGASFVRLRAVDPGVRTAGVVAATLHVDGARKGDAAAKNRFYTAVLARLAALPDVESAALALTPPLSGAVSRGIWIEGRPSRGPNEVEIAAFQTVSDGYFRTLAVPLLAGRAFVSEDAGGPPVAVVSAALARRYFGEPSAALGHRIGTGREGNVAALRTIVGVAGDVHDDGLAAPAPPTLYVPYLQNDEPWNMAAFLLAPRAGASGIATAPDAVRHGLEAAPEAVRRGVWIAPEAVRRAILDVDPLQPVTRVEALDEALSQELVPRRFSLWLAALFAGLAVLVAALGTHAVVSFEAATRRRETAIRRALGARGGQVLGGVLARGLRLAAYGIAAGWLGALVLGSLLGSLLFGTAPRDPWAFGAAAAALAAVAALASLLPAARAAAVPPAHALRDE